MVVGSQGGAEDETETVILGSQSSDTLARLRDRLKDRLVKIVIVIYLWRNPSNTANTHAMRVLALYLSHELSCSKAGPFELPQFC